MKLLANFNVDEMAENLEQVICERAKGWRGSHPITMLPTITVDHLIQERGVALTNPRWNHRHKQQALIKSLKLLSIFGVIEFVSLTKTKTTLGFIHVASNAPFRLVLDEHFEKEFIDIITPKRYIKYGEWRKTAS